MTPATAANGRPRPSRDVNYTPNVPASPKYSDQFKFKAALEAAQGVKTLNEFASQYNLHPNVVVLTAVADDNSTFTSWSGACTNTTASDQKLLDNALQFLG